MDNYIGYKVHSNLHGDGVVTDQIGKQITVDFPENGLSKEFTTPTCFRRYLRLGEPPASQQNRKLAWRDFQSIEDFILYYQKQLASEAEESSHTISSVELTNGICLFKNMEASVYTFETESAASLPVYYPLNIRIDKKDCSDDISGLLGNEKVVLNAEIISKDEEKITLILDDYLGKNITSAEAFSNSSFLLQKIIDRLDDCVKYSNLSRTLVLNKGNQLINSDSIHLGQDRAAEMAKKNEILFIWGPPGTGKTTTLARIAIELMETGKRILVLSNNNVAVDNAISKIAETSFVKNRILRYGHSADPQIRQSLLSSFTAALNGLPKTAKRREELLEELKGILSKENMDQKREELKQIRELLRQEEIKLVEEAQIVGTTLAKASLNPDLFFQKFDVVILDEASTTLIPAAVFAASLASAKFIALGDFKQLGPISINSKSDALKHDLFDFVLISDAVFKGISHNWLVMLNQQYRMHPQIAELVSDTVYQGLLKSDLSTLTSTKPITSSRPFPGNSVIKIDVSNYKFKSLERRLSNHRSIMCIESAILAVFSALSTTGTCAIITPFRLQAKLIKAILKSLSFEDKTLERIECSTIHSFQGSEKDNIVLDLTQSRQKLSAVFGLNSEGKAAERILNVGITRARGKLIIIGDFQYFQSKPVSGTLLDVLTKNGRSINQSELISEFIEGSNQLNWVQFLSREEAFPVFKRDINNAKRVLHCYKPKGSIWGKGVKSVLESFESDGISKLITTTEGNLDQVAGFELSASSTRVPYMVIDNEILWLNYPAFLRNEKKNLYEASVLRIEGKSIVRFMGRYLN